MDDLRSTELAGKPSSNEDDVRLDELASNQHVSVSFSSSPLNCFCKFIRTNGIALIGLILLISGIILVVLHNQCEAEHCRITKAWKCQTGSHGAVAIKSETQSCGRYKEKAWMCVLHDVSCVESSGSSEEGDEIIILTASTILHSRVQTSENSDMGALCESPLHDVQKACLFKWPINSTANVYEYNDFQEISSYGSKYHLGYAANINQEGSITLLIFGAVIFLLGMCLKCIAIMDKNTSGEQSSKDQRTN